MRRIAQIISAKFGQAAEELDFTHMLARAVIFFILIRLGVLIATMGNAKTGLFISRGGYWFVKGNYQAVFFSTFPIGWPLVCRLEPSWCL